MKLFSTFLTAGIALSASSTALAQNDECAGAVAVPLGATTIDTTAATTSPELWNCTFTYGNDLWFTHTVAGSPDNIRIETCGMTWDTVIEVYTGSCGSLTLVECNDDDCALQSGVEIAAPVAGTTYTFRVGGWENVGAGTIASGIGDLIISEVMNPPAAPPECVETFFASNNGGAPGGGIYFDVTAGAPTDISEIWTNYAAAGLPVGLEVWTTTGTSAGKETDPTQWTLAAMDDGTAIGEAEDTPSVITLATPLSLPAGLTGIALVAVGAGHEYTNGSGGAGTTDQFVSGDGNLTIDAGTATNTPFTAPIFSPRVWNGRLCAAGSGPGIGVNFCSNSVANSTGVVGVMGATGSDVVADNNVTLVATDLPPGFGIFVVSNTQLDPGNTMVPNNVGSLCLGGTVGRYQLPAQIFQVANGTGTLAIDLTAIPQASVTVAAVAGDVWNFQAWHRDVVGGAVTSNFTNALAITFQ